MRAPLYFNTILLCAAVARAQAPSGASTLTSPPVTAAPAPPSIQFLGGASNPLLGSVPAGAATPGEIALTLEDALARAYNYNLALTETAENVREVRAQRLTTLSRLLPTLSLRPSIVEQQVNLAALGFSGFPGVPSVIGPFTVYDARAYASQSILSLRNLRNYRSGGEQTTAAELTVRDQRDQVAVVVTGLYLQAIAGSARIDAQRAQVATAETAYRQAEDRRRAGTVPGIDVLRAQVEWQAEQQRLIFYEGEFQNQKLSLARAIGLPLGQQFRLADTIPYTPLPTDVTLEATLETAYRQRADYRAAQALVKAAELSKSAAYAGHYPSVALDANYGVIGPSASNLHGSFAVSLGVDIPIFEGGRIRAEVEAADAALRRRRAEMEDMRGRIDADVRTAFTDLRSASRQVEVAMQTVKLATEQLRQSQDRFAAGVTNNLEVVQAQQALAAANENQIAALYAFNVAKAELVRARGDAEQSIRNYLRRQP